jgi:hypothetical protein
MLTTLAGVIRLLVGCRGRTMFGLVLRRMVVALLAIVAVAAALATGCVSEEDADDFGGAQESEPSPTLEPLTDDPPTATPGQPSPQRTPWAVTPTPALVFAKPVGCPEPRRVTPAELGPAYETPPALSDIPGKWIEGGTTVQFTKLSFHLPEGRQFIIVPGIGDPGGAFWRIYDTQTDSALWIHPDGCESERLVRDPAADAVFNAIVASIEVASQPTATPEPAAATEPASYPTVGPPATPEPTATLTPTPERGVCPPPNRMTPEDFAEPPGSLPASELPGQRVQGGVAYSEGYLTLQLPQGREFVILSGWSEDESSLVISVYDVQTESSLIIRGDGCEIWGLIRQPAADAVFDEIMGTLEIGATYACPVPIREVVDEPPAEGPRGSVVQGGAPVQLGPLILHLPAGREFTLAGVPSDPGGLSLGVYDVQTRSGLWLRPDGCETGRRVSDPAADSVFDEIVATLEAPSR